MASGDKLKEEDYLKVYETERRDEQNTASLIIAVTTGTLAYFSAAAAYLADEARQAKISPNILMLAPFPLLILTGYVTFQYAASRIRQSYLMNIERRFRSEPWAKGVNYPGFITLHQGIFAGFKRGLWPYAILTGLTILSHVIIVVFFTGYTSYIAHREHAQSGWFWFLVAFYSLTICVNVAAIYLVFEVTVNPQSKRFKALRIIADDTIRTEARRWSNMSEDNRAAAPKLVGGAWLLRRVPPFWVAVGVALFSFCMIGILRLVSEGRYYDYALSSQFGDVMIALELAIISWILRKELPDNPGPLGNAGWHLTVGLLCFFAGLSLFLWSDGGSSTVANSYHNLMVVTFLSYLVISTFPILLASRDLFKLAATFCLLGWLTLVLYDVSHGNLTQNSPGH
ncbi:hypothetical protein ACIRP7_02885 [Streptomyces sp. NPDC102270]|uniref:hypothetical protein n=1 Tax=Streptomyces sp. NPDC102270 TaxID=3366150 RepID=UPI00381FB900